MRWSAHEGTSIYMPKNIEIFTDGACSGNPGPGGWAAIVRTAKRERELSGRETNTTNNRMELMAAIAALEGLKRPARVKIHTDSRYVVDGATKWVQGWMRNGWKTAVNKTVKNVDMWKRLVMASEPHRVKWVWVKAHNGHPENERADRLARNEIVKRCG